MKYNKENDNTTILNVTVDLDKALGAAHRNQYLEENPHGFAKTNRIHKNKKKYSRKQKHKNAYD